MTCSYFYNFASVRMSMWIVNGVEREREEATLTHPSNKLLLRMNECAPLLLESFALFAQNVHFYSSRKVKMFRLIWVRLVRFAKVRIGLVFVLSDLCFLLRILILGNSNPFWSFYFNVNFACLCVLFSNSPFNSIQHSTIDFWFGEHVKLHQTKNNYMQIDISFIRRLKTVRNLVKFQESLALYGIFPLYSCDLCP